MDNSKIKLFLTDRDMEILTILMSYHLTGQMVFELSQTFKTPFTSVNNTRARLSQLYRVGFLKRGVQFKENRGGNQYYYFLTKLSASLFPELAGISAKHATLQPIKLAIQEHSLAISEVMVKMHLDIHQYKDLCKLYGFIRENNYAAQGHGKRVVKADGTIIFKVNGQNQLLFLEVDLSNQTVRSAKPKATFQRKIEVYSEFKNYFHQDELIQYIGGVNGYRVLIVCKTEERLQSLVKLARDMNKGSMFWFTTKGRLMAGNCLSDKIWTLPQGQREAVFDFDSMQHSTGSCLSGQIYPTSQ